MKKKLWLILFTVILVVCITATFVACGNKEADEEGGASIAADYDYTLIENKINEIAGTDGIFIKLHAQTSATGETDRSFDIALGIKNDIYYFKDQENEYYYDLSSDVKAVVYSKEDGVWSKEETAYNAYLTKAQYVQVAKGASAGIIGYMGFYSGLSGNAVKSSATVAGRACDKYTIKETAAASAYSLEVCIDKATGVCLKYAASGAVPTARAGVSLECTEFNTSYTPVLPTVGGGNSQGNGGSGEQGGNGGSGEQGGNGGSGSGEGGNGSQGSGEGGSGQGGNGEVLVPSNFSGKKLTVTNVNVQTQDAGYRREAEAIFSDATASLFSDATFELVNAEGIMFGNFTVPNDGNVAQLSTFKCYDFEDGEYFYDFPSVYDSITLSYVVGAYVLHIPQPVGNGATVVDVGLTMTASADSPMRVDVPTDPNGDAFDARYQVTQEMWKDIFTNKTNLNGGNFTVSYFSTAPTSVAGTFKVDGNKYSDTWSNGGLYYEKTGAMPNASGAYAYTVYLPNGTQSPAFYKGAFFDQWLGTIPAPFLNKATYGEYTHYYTIGSFRYTPEGESQPRDIRNFKVMFYEGRITMIQYEEYGYSYNFAYSNYEETTVTLPGESGNQSTTVPASAAEVHALLTNKVLAYNMVTNNSGRLDNDELEVAREASQNAVLTIFEDNEFELHFDKLFDYDVAYSIESTFYGTYELTGSGTDTRGDYFAGSAAITTSVVDGEVDTDSFYQNVRWYTDLNLFRINMDDYFIYFEITEGTPTHIAIPENGGNGGGNGGEGGEGGGTQGGENVRTTIYTDFGTETDLHDTVMRLGMGDGVKIVMTVDEATYTFVGKEGVFFTEVDGLSMYYDLRDEENIDCYYYDGENWGVEPLDSLDAARSAMLSVFNYHYANYDSATRTEKSVTIGKSNVSAYRYETDNGDVFELDQTTGIVLCYDDGEGWIEEVTTFLLGDDVEDIELPALL